MAKNEIVKPREIVKADNELFRAKYGMKNTLAGRIFMAFASLVDENDVATEGRGNFIRYSIPASSVIGDINAGGNYYKELKQAAHSLLDQKLFRKIGKNGFQGYTLFATIIYENGIITGEFHKELKPFFLEVKKKFTRLSLNQYLKLPSIYSQQLFGFLQSWNDQPEIEITVSDLHEMLNTPNSLKRDFFNFKIRVLEKAHKDITGLTALRYEWEPIKQGRAVVAVRFIFPKKRTLPEEQKKQKDTKEEQAYQQLRQKVLDNMQPEHPATGDTRLIDTAMKCWKTHGGKCPEEHPAEDVCKLCRQIHRHTRLQQASLI